MIDDGDDEFWLGFLLGSNQYPRRGGCVALGVFILLDVAIILAYYCWVS